MVSETDPPCSIRAAVVKIETVPPTDGTAKRDAPNPRWIWMPEATSVKPCQFDQYTHPFSMSLTGWPLMRNDVFRWSNPRRLMRESP